MFFIILSMMDSYCQGHDESAESRGGIKTCMKTPVVLSLYIQVVIKARMKCYNFVEWILNGNENPISHVAVRTRVLKAIL